MRQILALFLLVVFVGGLTGCLVNEHTVGDGPRGAEVRYERNWYLFWGLMPISDVETRSLVGNESDYQVWTGMTFLDVFINFFTFPFSFLRQTTVVEK